MICRKTDEQGGSQVERRTVWERTCADLGKQLKPIESKKAREPLQYKDPRAFIVLSRQNSLRNIVFDGGQRPPQMYIYL